MLEFSTLHLGFFAKKAEYSGKIHQNTILGPKLKKIEWKFPIQKILTFIGFYPARGTRRRIKAAAAALNALPL
jgi:hypothetical protein